MRLHAVLMSGLAASWLACAPGCGGDPDVDFPETDDAFQPAEPNGDGPDDNGPGGTERPAVVINEIMYNPSIVRDELGEWLELFNAGGETLDLAGWTLRDYGNNRHAIDASVLLEPGDHVVLGRHCVTEENGGYVADYCYGDEFKLANDPGDGVELRNAEGVYVDSVSYDTYHPWPINTPGVSIELSSPAADNLDPQAWTLAVMSYGDGDLGTPGLPNGS